MKQRLPSLDLIRGFALFGVLAVNAAYFAAPLASVINPGFGPLSVSPATTWSWFVPYVFFEYKSMALFSMLFGVSLFLVGGDRNDPERSATLRRRLGWLALFGMGHGVALWFGDILLSYAITGSMLLRARAWSPRALLAIGTALFVVSMGVIAATAGMITSMSPAEQAAFAASSWTLPADALETQIHLYRHGWAQSQLTNLGTWIDFQLQTLLFLTPRTAGLMMIGLALFKTGFLSGRMRTQVYAACLALGAAALMILAWNGWDMARQGFPLVRVQAIGTLLTAGLAPIVAIGYAAGIILILRAGLVPWLTQTLAAVGRMAFTNYLVQSIALSTLCWSGRGFGLYGALSRPQVMGIALLLFVVQAIFSVWWLRNHEHGPFERLWRHLSRARSVPHTVTQRPVSETRLAVETAALTKRFGAHTAVAGVDLAVPEGAIYGFLGANGAGKTTTIRMLLGLMRPSAGSARIFGHDVQRDRLLAAREIGALLEARATYDHLTGRENLDITRRLLRLPERELDRVLTLVDLRHAESKKAGHYSLGMRQRLGLARALLGKPRLLLLDEPMNGLDPDGIAEMRRTIRDLPDATGVTVFLSSHLLAEVEQVASHIGLMANGQLVAQDTLIGLLGRTAPDLCLRTSDDCRARAVLADAGLPVSLEAAGLVVPGQGGEGEAARVACLLVGAGFALHALTPRPTDLEALYLSWNPKKVA